MYGRGVDHVMSFIFAVIINIKKKRKDGQRASKKTKVLPRLIQTWQPQTPARY